MERGFQVDNVTRSEPTFSALNATKYVNLNFPFLHSRTKYHLPFCHPFYHISDFMLSS